MKCNETYYSDLKEGHVDPAYLFSILGEVSSTFDRCVAANEICWPKRLSAGLASLGPEPMSVILEHDFSGGKKYLKNEQLFVDLRIVVKNLGRPRLRLGKEQGLIRKRSKAA